MIYRNAWLVLLTAWLKVMVTSTVEDKCRDINYINLVGSDQNHRYLNFTSTNAFSLFSKTDLKLNGSDFKLNWFRFRIPEANRMLDKSDLPEEINLPTDNSPFSPCGAFGLIHVKIKDKNGFMTNLGKITTWFYVLNDLHPLTGTSFTSAIPCQYLHETTSECHIGFGCNWKLFCHNRPVRIIVRNCGSYYIYKTLDDIEQKSSIWPNHVKIMDPLTSLKAGSFCGTNLPEHNVCKKGKYEIVKDEREWDKMLPVQHSSTCNDDETFTSKGWVRFQSERNLTMKLVENCQIANERSSTSSDSSNKYRCGALYRGWVMGNHPTVAEGRVDRKICFSLANKCSCKLSTEISIYNCGDFFLYRRKQRDFPHCYARACTVPDQRRLLKENPVKKIFPTRRIMQPLPSSANQTLPSMMTSSSSSSSMISSTETMSTRVIKDQSNTTVLVKVHATKSLMHVQSSIVHAVKKRLTSLCHEYETVIDNSRLFQNLDFASQRNYDCDLSYYEATRFMTSSGVNLELKEGCSPSERYNKTCSSFDTNVWLPSFNREVNGLQVVPICIQRNIINWCQCDRTDYVLVEKCTSSSGDPFFVYRLYPIFHSRGNESDAKKCAFKYCFEPQVGSKPQSRPALYPNEKSQERFGVIGSFTVMSPLINTQPLSQEHIASPMSKIYQFLATIMKERITRSLASVRGVSRVEITGMKIGSLIVEYKIYGTNDVSSQSINENIRKSLQKNPKFNQNDGSLSFSGTGDPQSQQIQGIDLCSSNPCDKNAECLNNENNTFTCRCVGNYRGDGYSCNLHTRKEIVDNKWSTDSVIIVTVLFSVCFIIIIVLLFCLCCRHKESYIAKQGVSKHGFTNYENYYSTDAPFKLKESVRSSQNRYMSSDVSTTPQHPQEKKYSCRLFHKQE